MELLIILVLILLNGLFSMSEIALVSARKSRLEAAAKRGNRKARAALNLANAPNTFLSTVQIGITLIGILTGIYSGENITTDLGNYLLSRNFPEDYAHSAAVVIVVVGITYLTLILGELVPKRIGLTNPERVSRLVAIPMRVISLLAAPFVWLLTLSTEGMIRLLGIRPSADNRVTEEEIRAIIREGTKGGEVQEIEQDIVERVFLIGDRKVDSLMTHRSQVVMLGLHDDRHTVRQTAMDELHSVYPVYSDNKDRIEGMVALKDLFLTLDREEFSLSNLLQPAQFFSENATAYEALDTFKKTGKHHGIVVDEYGVTQGIITINDILEALAGPASELYREAYRLINRGDGTYLVDGHYPFHDFLAFFDVVELGEGYDFNTISGLLLEVHGGIPQQGDVISWKNFRFEVLDMDGPRIDKLLVTQISAD